MILSQGDKTVRLELVDVSNLKAHEEIVSYLTDQLEINMRRDGLQRDPIIIDEKSKAVLDGMHRLEVLRRLGVESAVCDIVDYASAEVGLYRWLRLVNKPTPELLLGLERGLDLSFTGSEGEEIPTRLELWYRGHRLQSKQDMDLPDICEAMRRFDRIVSEEGARVEFIDEETFRNGSNGGEVAVLVTPRILKRHVIAAARTGSLLPSKSTLHVFPIRPVGVNYPVDDLRLGRDELETLLASRKRTTVKPPVIRDGRRYREELLVFE